MNKVLLGLLLIVSGACAKRTYVNQPLKSNQGLTRGCQLHFSQQKICLKTKWIKYPTESDFGEIDLLFYDENDSRLVLNPNGQLEIILWMPSMGHGSSPVNIQFIERGHYRGKDVFFIMPGAWDIRYQIKDGNRILEEVIEKINI